MNRSQRKRRPTERAASAQVINNVWTDQELRSFFSAFKRHGNDWQTVARDVNNHSYTDVVALYEQHKTVLDVSTVDVKILLAIHKDRTGAPAAASTAASNSSARKVRNSPLRANGTAGGNQSPSKSSSSPGAAAAALSSAAKRKRSRQLFPEELEAQLDALADRPPRRDRKLSIDLVRVPQETEVFFITGRAGLGKPRPVPAPLPPASTAPSASSSSSSVAAASPRSTRTRSRHAKTALPKTLGASASATTAETESTERRAKVARSSSSSRRRKREPGAMYFPRKGLHWCVYDAFYSAIDAPYFSFSEYRECMERMGLPRQPSEHGANGSGGVSRVDRKAWISVKRQMHQELGHPRRFSAVFLAEERVRLEQYRTRVRTYLSEGPAGISGGAPDGVGAGDGGLTGPGEADRERPAALRVGQMVMAVHPTDRLPQYGRVLTADVANGKFRIQFDRGDLGVHLLPDSEIMPCTGGEGNSLGASDASNELVMPWADAPMQIPVQPDENAPPRSPSASSSSQTARPSVAVDLGVSDKLFKLMVEKTQLDADARGATAVKAEQQEGGVPVKVEKTEAGADDSTSAGVVGATERQKRLAVVEEEFERLVAEMHGWGETVHVTDESRAQLQSRLDGLASQTVQAVVAENTAATASAQLTGDQNSDAPAALRNDETAQLHHVAGCCLAIVAHLQYLASTAKLEKRAGVAAADTQREAAALLLDSKVAELSKALAKSNPTLMASCGLDKMLRQAREFTVGATK